MKKFVLLSVFSFSLFTSSAQTGADYLKAAQRADVEIVFDLSDTGKEYKVNWGMDAAWDWDFNVKRGVAHIGKGNFATGRVSFQPNDLVTDNGDGTYSLTDRQKKKLQWRCNLIKLTGTTEVNLNCDHEALFRPADSNGNYLDTDERDYMGRTNYRGKPQEWYKLIKASVQYVQSQGLKVVSVSPFNEPDFVWEQATDEDQAKRDFLAIARLIKADDFFKDIRVCGGNTLNNDKAWTWFYYLRNYLDEGNTHQLAGSFDNYANFFTRLKREGKVATADELHNVGEAIVGVNYGMENGIWWGFDSKARGQFCLDSNEGVRLGYGENRAAWTCGAVYRNNTTGEVHGYLGSSERQASTSTFAFVSKDRDVYFNGDGPTRRYVFEVPGGTGYQKGQINAERVFDITWGEDVAPCVINGTYLILNQYSGKVLTGYGNANVTTSSLQSSGTSQHWKVTPGYTTGDISNWFIDNVTTGKNSHLNVLNLNLDEGANVICWSGDGDGKHLLEEQWYLKYAQDGYYYIISRLSNKYLYCTNTASGSEVCLKEGPSPKARSKSAYLWRFQPIDSKAETRAPAAPTTLTAQEQGAEGMELAWTAPVDNDALTYIVLRADAPQQEGEEPEYNTIARGVATTSYTDKTAEEGKHYYYKVKAVDYAGNRSKASEELATGIDAPAAVMQSGKESNGERYDLSGKPASDTSTGIIIQGQKKIYVR